MSEHERPSLHLATLIDEERARDYGDANRSAQILAGITKAIAAGAGAALVAASATHVVAATAAEGAAAAKGAAAGAHAVTAAAAKGTAVWTTSKVLAVAVLSVVVGAVGGVGAQRVLSAPPPAPTSVAVSVAPPQPSTPPPTPSDEAPSPPLPVVSSPRPRGVATASTSAPRASNGDLEREQALIDVARAGLARSHPDVALDAIARHEAAYPHGQLSEERDGLRIVALLRSGHRDEARVRAGTFRTSYPKSALWPKIERALESEGP